MSIEDANSTTTRPAVDALLRLNQQGRRLCPDGADPDAWAASVLYDLARMADLFDGAVEQVSGRRNDNVAQNGQALSSTIAAHRNLHVGEPRG